ncbi:NAD(P)/FAD-dependent oxidoreductase [Pseudanabaena sp. PCC 6802]|uniref:NAD(P)/FAD-dependent oxidoreductase n=1 Tax=Pseudanabaena sp. PCC 6802 TaxID=118173 RepID=UPI0003468908
MKTYDWIVVGGGITGAALSYELGRVGFSVLLLEPYPISDRASNATRYSYGGIPYWSGTTPLTRQLCTEGIDIQSHLTDELGADTEFRYLDLVLTIGLDEDVRRTLAGYRDGAIAPTLVSVSQACELEPLLDSKAIAGALLFKHAHVNPRRLVAAYCSAFQRHGGTLIHAKLERLLCDRHRTQGAIANGTTYHANNVAICAGGMSRQLLKDAGIHIKQYFTHAELIETKPVDLKLRALVMPATNQRMQFETDASQGEIDALWDESDRELAPPSIDPGAIQFLDRTIEIGQLSRLLTNPHAKVDAVQSEAKIRSQVGKVLPAIASLPGQWHSCLVAFSQDGLPLIGAVPDYANIHIFSGFTSPMVYVPTLARRFAAFANGASDDIIPQLSPLRFA